MTYPAWWRHRPLPGWVISLRCCWARRWGRRSGSCSSRSTGSCSMIADPNCYSSRRLNCCRCCCRRRTWRCCGTWDRRSRRCRPCSPSSVAGSLWERRSWRTAPWRGRRSWWGSGFRKASCSFCFGHTKKIERINKVQLSLQENCAVAWMGSSLSNDTRDFLTCRNWY